MHASAGDGQKLLNTEIAPDVNHLDGTGKRFDLWVMREMRKNTRGGLMQFLT